MDIKYFSAFPIDLPPDAAETLDRLANDCDLSPSQCVTQLLRRHGADLHRLFATNIPISSVPVVSALRPEAEPSGPSTPTAAPMPLEAAPKSAGGKLTDWLNS
jgi:hypothetical protein